MLTYMLFNTQSSCQQQAGMVSQLLTYILFKTQSTACFCQQQPERASQMLTYILSKTQIMLLSAMSRECQPDAHLHTI